MTTKNSPLHVLKAQADKIAATIKAAERGEAVDARFAARIEAARHQESFKVGIVMDDKVLTIELPWSTIRGTSEAGLAEFVLNQMREVSDAVH